MRFKDFITRQRITIFIAGLVVFGACVTIAHINGASTLPGELSVDLAATAVTVIFTALIIDYLHVLEEGNRTKNVADLAEQEVKAACFRIKWQMARFFGLKWQSSKRSNISNRQEARAYVDIVSEEVNGYLENNHIMSKDTPIDEARFERYLQRLQQAQVELEQTLILYEYAMPYNLRERILNLRRELQVSDYLLGFIDDSLNKANVSLIRVMSQSIYDLTAEVLDYYKDAEAGITVREDVSLNN